MTSMLIVSEEVDVRDEIRCSIEENEWSITHDGPSQIVFGAELKLVKFANNEVTIPDVTRKRSSISEKNTLDQMNDKGIGLNKDDVLWLLQNRDRIPKDWRSYNLVTSFACKDGAGDLRVLCLIWDGFSWDWSFYYASYAFGSDDRAAFPVNLRLEAGMSLL